MNFSIKQINNTINLRALIIGIGGVSALYLILIIYSLITTPSLLKQTQAKTPKRIINIVGTEKKTRPILIEKSKESKKNVKNKDAEKHYEATHTAPSSTTPFKPIKPIKSLYEETNTGYLPQKNSDGLSPFEAYRRPVKPINPKHKKIAIALTDIGLSEKVSKNAIIELPAEISLILSPYANQPKKWQNLISAHGHELWISIPAENKYYPMSEPGSQGLLSRASYDQNKERLTWSMTRTHGYAGIAIHSDEAFSNARNTLKSLINFVLKRGLGYLELNPQTPHRFDIFAAQLNAPYLKNTIQKNAVFAEYIKILEQQADNKSTLISTFPATPANIKAIKTWAKTLKQKGITLLPLSSAHTQPKTKSAESSATQKTEEEKIIHTEKLSDKDHQLHSTDHEPETHY